MPGVPECHEGMPGVPMWRSRVAFRGWRSRVAFRGVPPVQGGVPWRSDVAFPRGVPWVAFRLWGMCFGEVAAGE